MRPEGRTDTKPVVLFCNRSANAPTVSLFTPHKWSTSTSHLSPRWRWVVYFTTMPLCTRERTPAPIEYEAALAPEAVLTFWRK